MKSNRSLKSLQEKLELSRQHLKRANEVLARPDLTPKQRDTWEKVAKLARVGIKARRSARET